MGAKIIANRLGDGDAAMRAAGAADCDHQAALALLVIVREQEVKHIADLCHKLPRDRMLHHKVAHIRVQSGMPAQLRNVEGIGQKTDVEENIRLAGQSALEAEGHDLDADAVIRRFA